MSYSAQTFVADEQPTTAKWNLLWSNDASFNDGTGIATGALIARHFAAGGVDAPARSEVVHVGVIPGATFGSTGNKAITGVGFTPKAVIMMPLVTTNASIHLGAIGFTNGTTQFVSAWAGSGSTQSRNSSQAAYVGWMASGGTSFNVLGSHVSFDADGFTFNLSAAASTFDFGYMAIA